MYRAKEEVAYFDFDGTITSTDTFLCFLLYVVGWWRFILHLPQLSIVGLLYALRIISNEVAKGYTLTILVKGYSEKVLDSKAKQFASTIIDKYIKPEIFQRLEYHLEHGHTVILVSANLGIYLRYWALRHKLAGVIATEMEFINGRASGRLATRNCYAQEKVSRVKQFLVENKLNFSYSYAYGNSRGDYELLEFVNEAFWIDGVQLIAWDGR
jgi:HAD superfamily hydrolase (TIGR01490 family)